MGGAVLCTVSDVSNAKKRAAFPDGCRAKLSKEELEIGTFVAANSAEVNFMHDVANEALLLEECLQTLLVEAANVLPTVEKNLRFRAIHERSAEILPVRCGHNKCTAWSQCLATAV